MKLSEIEIGTPISILVKHEEEELNFDVAVEAVVGESVLVNALRSEEGKLIDFNSQNVSIELYIKQEGDKPLLFTEVTLKCVSYKKNIYHQIITEKEAVAYNRRDTVRVFIGIQGKAQVGPNKTALDITVKDVSCEGFGIVCERPIIGAVGGPVRVVFKDADQHFDLRGVIVREYRLDNGRVVYGCRIERREPMLQRYVNVKQRQQMSRN